MGTRHLICVYDTAGELRVAQYGQWDGYPEGQGSTILNYLENTNGEAPDFSEVSFASQERIAEIEAADIFPPEFDRDLGALIFELIGTRPLELINSFNFGADSLFCEFAYVVDYQKREFEIHRGFNTKFPNPEGRFSQLPVEGDYYPVRLIGKYSFDALPSVTDLVELVEKADNV